MIFSEFLINQELPEGHKIKGPITKRKLSDHLTELAIAKPDIYPSVVKNIKRLGDTFATFEGISVGLDDITPHYKERDELFKETKRKISKAKNEHEVIQTLIQTQEKAMDLLKEKEGSLHRQVSSGSRGKPGQLLKTVFSPVVAKGRGDVAQPYLIEKSYVEGLSPGAFWLTAGESRRELATTQLATAIPGDTSKQISATLNAVTISKPDCGTKNGLEYDLNDHHIYDRYEAVTDKLITAELAKDLQRAGRRTIIVRSPLTCLENPGVCQKCFGKNNHGQLHDPGTHIGLRSAQALSEPLTQMVLSAKHGGMMAHSGETKLRGTFGFRQLVDMPSVFKDEANMAEEAGRVEEVSESPQGGLSIVVAGRTYYASPRRKVVVQVGDQVKQGEPLTDGIPNPKDVVRLRGMGAGRKYMADTIYDIYRDSGVDIDKRHVELLVKQDLNHVKVLESKNDGGFVRGDIVPYNSFRDNVSEASVRHKVSKHILGQPLGQDFLHYTIGTSISDEILSKLKQNKVKTVLVAQKAPEFEPVVRPLEQIPLMSEDWVSRLAHRKLKDTLLEGAAKAWSSDIRGASPYPRIIYGG